MLLKEVHITGLWNKYNLKWELNESVNILSGINGVGKTTLINIIRSLISNRTEENCLKKIRQAVLVFSEGYSIIYAYEPSNSKSEVLYKLDDTEIDFDRFKTNIRSGVVSTFDSRMPSLKEYQEQIVSKGDKIRSQLDWVVERFIGYYYKYINIISQEVENAIKKNEVEKLTQFYQQKNLFLELVNEMFHTTRKTILESEEGLVFQLEDGNRIPANELSSGEKQLLILLICALVEREKEYINFWDEPEISLHIDWQRRLIRTMRSLNPNAQLIISTHSPSIIYEGWEQMVVNMEDLLNDTTK